MQVKEIISLKGGILYTTTPQQLLSAAIDTMADLDVGSLVVMDGGKMAGLLTFREVLMALKAHNACPVGVTVGDVMLKDPVAVTSNTEVNDLRQMMIESRSRYLPVVDDGTLLSIVSLHDVAKAVLEEQNFENKMLKNYIKNWPDGKEEA